MARPLQSLFLRRAIVTHLRADSALVALGSPALAERIYGPRSPGTLTWPFVRVNVSDEGPLRKGTTIRVTVHAFSKAQFDDEVSSINAALTASLEDEVLTLSPGYTAYMRWLGSQVIPDAAEADAYHGVNSFDATIG